MDKLKRDINKRPVQLGILFLWITAVLAVFIPHVIAHLPTFVDKKNIISCASAKTTHRVQITPEGFKPQKLTTNVCDQIVFINTGTKIHKPAFGPHPIHLVYPGFQEIILKPGESNQFILFAYGNYQIHDHFDDELTMRLQIDRGNNP